ncbi:hypothetical protein GOBAR_DD18909 [Gossypium barbadense]|nr:hypothetical protein GOBAR_DD18909 [Gossypium barbadense]
MDGYFTHQQQIVPPNTTLSPTTALPVQALDIDTNSTCLQRLKHSGNKAEMEDLVEKNRSFVDKNENFVENEQKQRATKNTVTVVPAPLLVVVKMQRIDSFVDTEFWYVDQGIVAPEADGLMNCFGKALQRQEEKWWLPVPRVPPGGLDDRSRKQLQHKRDCTNQILKAAMAINNVTLADIEVPESYLEALPKNGRANLGDVIYRHISSDMFTPECLLDCLNLSSEHQAIEIANRVEALMYLWRKRPVNNAARSSWELVKDLMVDVDKRDILADRAESLLLCLKQRFPGLPQTTLDMTKIQYNKEILDSFVDTEFWYVDQGIVAPEADGLMNCFGKALQRQEEKWWLPVPRVPPGGLDDRSRKQLQHKRDCTNQILKAAMAINNVTLADIEVPESYLEALPKDVGKSILESYSRVLESLAHNIVARIDDLLYIDDLTKHSEQFSSLLRAGLIGPKSVSSTPYRTTFTTPNFSPAQLASPAKVDRS